MKTIQHLLAGSFLFVSTLAHAHIEPGTWSGVTASGATCSFVAGDRYFENNLKNPLNERIQLQLGTNSFVVQHPQVISFSEKTVGFNHDAFEGVLAFAGGAKAIRINMVHLPNQEGPTSFQVITHQWSDDQSESIECNQLKHAK